MTIRSYKTDWSSGMIGKVGLFFYNSSEDHNANNFNGPQTKKQLYKYSLSHLFVC